MKNPIHPLSLYAGGIGLALGQIAYYYPQLPDKLASHFNGAGVADGWMAKNDFMIFYIVLLLFTGGTLAGTGLLISKLPTDMINLPNREYWLAPERKAGTVRALSEQMHWFGAATMVLLIAMMQLTFQANLLPEPRLDSKAWMLLVAYVVYTIIWTIGLVGRYSRTE